jgi:hypothetical protein
MTIEMQSVIHVTDRRRRRRRTVNRTRHSPAPPASWSAKNQRFVLFDASSGSCPTY